MAGPAASVSLLRLLLQVKANIFVWMFFFCVVALRPLSIPEFYLAMNTLCLGWLFPLLLLVLTYEYITEGITLHEPINIEQT